MGIYAETDAKLWMGKYSRGNKTRIKKTEHVK